MRVFAALPIPTDVKSEIARVGRLIKVEYENVKLVKEHNMHLTIHFFGETDEVALKSIISVMENISLPRSKMELALGGLGFFPPRGNPRVIFVDIDTGREVVYRFHEVFAKLIEEKGFKLDSKPFQTHITVARNRGARINAKSLTDKIEYRKLHFTIDRFVLFRSILHKEGPEYIPLKTVMFR